MVTSKAGRRFSYHYVVAGAIQAAKDSGRYRVVHGIHRGDWKALGHYNKGVKVTPEPVKERKRAEKI